MECFRHLVQSNPGELRGVQLNIRKVFLMLCILSGQFIRYIHLVLGRTPLCHRDSLNSSGHGNVARLVSRDLTLAMKTFHIPLHHLHQTVYLTLVRMGQWIHAAYAKSLLCHLSMTQQEPGFVGPGDVFPLLNCPVLVITCPLAVASSCF